MSAGMFDDLLDNWVEPSPDTFDAYFYDGGKPSRDLSRIPDFLLPYVEYPECGSGTNKYLYLLYQFASRARLGLECGVFTGVSTIPLAKGLQHNDGELTSIDRDLSHPALHQRIRKHGLSNVTLLGGSDLDFRPANGTHRTDEYAPNHAIQSSTDTALLAAPPGLRTQIHCVGSPPPWVPASFDFIYIDTAHTYEHTVKELFMFDRHLNAGGVFLVHDIVVALGVGLKESTEDYGYSNGAVYIDTLIRSKDAPMGIHISQYPICQPTPNCLMTPVYLAIQTFLSYRPDYRMFKVIDFAGMAIIWKPPEGG